MGEPGQHGRTTPNHPCWAAWPAMRTHATPLGQRSPSTASAAAESIRQHRPLGQCDRQSGRVSKASALENAAAQQQPDHQNSSRLGRYVPTPAGSQGARAPAARAACAMVVMEAFTAFHAAWLVCVGDGGSSCRQQLPPLVPGKTQQGHPLRQGGGRADGRAWLSGPVLTCESQPWWQTWRRSCSPTTESTSSRWAGLGVSARRQELTKLVQPSSPCRVFVSTERLDVCPLLPQDLDPLASLPKLHTLSLVGNPVATNKDYR